MLLWKTLHTASQKSDNLLHLQEEVRLLTGEAALLPWRAVQHSVYVSPQLARVRLRHGMWCVETRGNERHVACSCICPVMYRTLQSPVCLAQQHHALRAEALLVAGPGTPSGACTSLCGQHKRAIASI